MKCIQCKIQLDDHTAYEYRGVLSCFRCFDLVAYNRDLERQDIIDDSQRRTEKLKGLDISNSSIGKANKELLKSTIEICGKESIRRKTYEGSLK